MSENSIRLKADVARVYEPAPNAVREFAAPSVGKVDLNTAPMELAVKLEKIGILVKKQKVKKTEEES